MEMARVNVEGYAETAVKEVRFQCRVSRLARQPWRNTPTFRCPNSMPHAHDDYDACATHKPTEPPGSVAAAPTLPTPPTPPLCSADCVRSKSSGTYLRRHGCLPRLSRAGCSRSRQGLTFQLPSPLLEAHPPAAIPTEQQPTTTRPSCVRARCSNTSRTGRDIARVQAALCHLPSPSHLADPCAVTPAELRSEISLTTESESSHLHPRRLGSLSAALHQRNNPHHHWP